MRRLLLMLTCITSLASMAWGMQATDLSIEDRVGQLLMVWFDGEEVNDEAERLLNEARIGSIIYYRWANGLSSPEQIYALSSALQQLANKKGLPPLLIATDEEGGMVSRLQEGFTDFPGNGALGRTDDPRLAYLEAKAIGKELKAVGINYNLAPVVDINNNPDNPVIGIRSFGSSPELVADFAKEAMRGYLDSGIIPCLKHFPGHGDVAIDSHTETPIVDKTIAELTKMELKPYLHLAGDAPSIMTVHILFPHIDPFQTATLSSPILQEMLRDKIDYKGVIITDSLTMKGAQKDDTPLEQTALEAFLGGNDILLTGGRSLFGRLDGEARSSAIISIYNTLLKAVKEGVISEERLNASVDRILLLKDRAGLFQEMPLLEDPPGVFCGTEDHFNLAKQIAYSSVEVLDGSFPLSLQSKKVAILAPNVLKSRLEKTPFATRGKETLFYYFDYINPSEKEITAALEHLDTFDTVIFFSFNAWKRPKQLQFLETIASTSKLDVLVATGEARDLSLIPQVNLKIATYSPSIPSVKVATEYIIGETRPLRIPPEESLEIGMRVWMNTSKQSTRDLTCWTEGLEFPTMGIGHFKWPPYTYRGIFSKGEFHELLSYLKGRGVELPAWLEKSPFSPWTTKNQFYRAIESEDMKTLRALLCNTIPLQAEFMTKRLNSTYLDMIRPLSLSERKHLTKQFFRIADAPNGHYILTDYLTFQNSGTSPKEQYNERGWGLKQVLQMMGSPGAPENPIEDFIGCAASVLEYRVQNAPPERNEKQWLHEWLVRLQTYAH